MPFAVGKEVEDGVVRLVNVGGLAALSFALKADVALSAVGVCLFAEVVEEHAAAALVVGGGVGEHFADASCVFFLTIAVDMGRQGELFYTI